MTPLDFKPLRPNDYIRANHNSIDNTNTNRKTKNRKDIRRKEITVWILQETNSRYCIGEDIDIARKVKVPERN